MSESGDTFILRRIDDGDSFTSFKSGDAAFAALKQFARTKAKAYERESLSRTYVFYDQALGRVAAYITLVSSEVRASDAASDAERGHFPYEHYPAVKIARLLVDERYRGGEGRPSPHLGRQLVDFALAIAKEDISTLVGCRFLTVDAKAQSVRFYERCGFTFLDTPDNRARQEKVMFIDLAKL